MKSTLIGIQALREKCDFVRGKIIPPMNNYDVNQAVRDILNNVPTMLDDLEECHRAKEVRTPEVSDPKL